MCFTFEGASFVGIPGCHTLSLLHLIFNRLFFRFVFFILCCLFGSLFSCFLFLFVSAPTVAHMNSCTTKRFCCEIPPKTSQQNRSPRTKPMTSCTTQTQISRPKFRSLFVWMLWPILVIVLTLQMHVSCCSLRTLCREGQIE